MVKKRDARIGNGVQDRFFYAVEVPVARRVIADVYWNAQDTLQENRIWLE